MIRINVVPDGIIAQGHANYSKPGQDIVCAAVSTLLQTLELRGTATKDKGSMIVHTEDKEALRLVVEGLRLIESNYPENVKVIMKFIPHPVCATCGCWWCSNMTKPCERYIRRDSNYPSNVEVIG